jgi:hypothetical protein
MEAATVAVAKRADLTLRRISPGVDGYDCFSLRTPSRILPLLDSAHYSGSRGSRIKRRHNGVRRMIDIFHQIHPVRVIRGDYDIVAIKVLDDTAFRQGNHPAGILVHAIVYEKNGLSLPQRCFHKNRRVQL